MREIVKAASELVPFRVDVTPRLERPPVVKERRLRLRRPDRGRREPLFDDLGRTPRPPRVIPPRLTPTVLITAIPLPARARAAHPGYRSCSDLKQGRS